MSSNTGLVLIDPVLMPHLHPHLHARLEQEGYVVTTSHDDSLTTPVVHITTDRQPENTHVVHWISTSIEQVNHDIERWVHGYLERRLPRFH